MKNKKITVLIVLALVLALSLCVQGAMAYFTTYVVAEGGKTIRLGRKTEIHEEVSNWTKSITIQNVGDTDPTTGDTDCYVRVKYFAGNAYQLTPEAGEDWQAGNDGYWYYAKPLKLGETTSALKIKINFDQENIPEDFNVIVIHENTDVLYDEQGNPYADWNLTQNQAPGTLN